MTEKRDGKKYELGEKAMKSRKVLLFMAAVMVIGTGVSAEESSLKPAAETEAVTDEAEELELQPDEYTTVTFSKEEIPEAVAAYTKPEALSENLEDYQIELDGEVYALPVPVSVLIADGWELDENDSDSEIEAGDYGWVTLKKGGQELHDIAVNPESYAVIPENCWIEGLTAGGYTLDAVGVLPGGIRTGMPETDFIRILDDAGVSYETDDSSDSFKYYTYSEKEYGQCFEVTVYTSDDGYFEKDTIMEVTCNNTF